MSNAKAIEDRRRADERAHHAERIEWLSADAPKWADGSPVGKWDCEEMLQASRRVLDRYDASMPLVGNSEKVVAPSPAQE